MMKNRTAEIESAMIEGRIGLRGEVKLRGMDRAGFWCFMPTYLEGNNIRFHYLICALEGLCSKAAAKPLDVIAPDLMFGRCEQNGEPFCCTAECEAFCSCRTKGGEAPLGLTMECEMCGSGEAEYLIQVEGAKLNVCRDCSGTGKILRWPSQASQNAGKGAQAPARARVELEVVDGYGAIIQSGRKKLGLPIEVLAERINEKLSFLERIEHQKTLPDEKIARKLEKELSIVLLQEVAESDAAGDTKKGAPVTLGDIIEIEKRERKKKE